jgi:hypothetical protein
VSKLRRLVVWTAGLALVAVTALWFFLFSPLQAVDFVDAACPDACAVLDGDDLEVPGDAATGLIVYTGARVVPEAYAPVAEAVAAAGYPVFIPRLTLNFAIFDADAADAVIAENPEIDRWVIAGHSLGGVMAARYAAANDQIAGLVFWASYPEDSLDLSDTDLVVASIYGSEDGLSTPDTVLAVTDNLPADAEFIEIEGGNHAQFGNYGAQRGDQPATIPAEEQWSIIADATIVVLDTVHE